LLAYTVVPHDCGGWLLAYTVVPHDCGCWLLAYTVVPHDCGYFGVCDGCLPDGYDHNLLACGLAG
jgi:hypothetical protein